MLPALQQLYTATIEQSAAQAVAAAASIARTHRAIVLAEKGDIDRLDPALWAPGGAVRLHVFCFVAPHSPLPTPHCPLPTAQQ